MKKSIILITFICSFTHSNIANAQFWENNSIYLGLGWKHGTYKGLSWDINYIQMQNYSLQLRATGGFRDAANSPLDSKRVFIENFNAIEFQIGRVYPLNKTKTITTNLKIGLAHNSFKYPISYEWHPASMGFFGDTPSRYTAEWKREKNIGYIINPNIQFHLGKRLGISIAPHININSYHTAYEGQIRLTFMMIENSTN